MLEQVTQVFKGAILQGYLSLCSLFLWFSVAQGFCELSFSLHTSFDNFPKAKSNIRVIVSFPHKDGDCVLPRSNFSLIKEKFN